MSLPSSYESKSTDIPFAEGLIWSLIAHLALGIILLVKSLVFPSDNEIYQPALKVDMVALPDLTKQELEKLTVTGVKPKVKSSGSKAKPVPKGEMILKDRKKRKSKIKNALSRIKSISQIKEQENEAAPDIIKGNILSKGTTLSGDAKEKEELTYFDMILERVKANWSLPVWLARQNLSAQALVLVDPTGQVISIRIQKSSGSDQFDLAVKDAIREASPFPTPPPELRRTLQSSGILLGFPL